MVPNPDPTHRLPNVAAEIEPHQNGKRVTSIPFLPHSDACLEVVLGAVTQAVSNRIKCLPD